MSEADYEGKSLFDDHDWDFIKGWTIVMKPPVYFSTNKKWTLKAGIPQKNPKESRENKMLIGMEYNFKFHSNKVVRVFPVIIWSDFHMRQHRGDRQEDAPHLSKT